jgi:hypothetical protein
VRVGEEAFGRFRVEALIGRQRSTTAFAATTIAGGEPVVLTTAARSRPDEARSVARALDPFVTLHLSRFARVVAAGVDGPTAWAASVRPEGTSLRAHLTTVRRVDVGQAIELAVAVLAALEDLHEAGHAHLSLRPEGIFFSEAGLAGTLTIAELELARLSLGAPLIVPTLAPEQLDAALGEAGPRADLFAVGAIVYELISGVPPFAGTSAALAASIATDTHEPLSARRAGIPPALDRALDRALAKDPAKRFASARELAQALGATRAPARAATARVGEAPSAMTPRGGVPIEERPPDDEVSWSAGAAEGGAGKSSHAKARTRTGAPRFSGALASQQIAYVRRAYGASTVDRAIAALAPEDRDEISAAAPAAWIRVDAFERFHVSLANVLGRPVEQTHPEISKNGGKSTFQSLWRVLLRIGGASFIMSRAPVVYAKTYDTGVIESRDIGESGGSFVLIGWPDVPEFVLRGLRAGMSSALEAVGRTGVELTSHRNTEGATFRARWDR